MQQLKEDSHDMVHGPIFKHLIVFTIPLVLGNIFQLIYNTTDSIIVGRLVGKNALAAVGTCAPIMNLAILLISGMCMGASILMSSLYGLGDIEKLKRQISTTMIGGCIFSIVFSVLMVCLAHPIMWLIHVPSEIINIALQYLRIIYMGLIFTFIYNFLANTMRALGDSKTSLYFLIISAVLNVFGDLFFVGVLRWGVEGSAVSTVISEALCCILCMVYINKKVPLLCLGREWFVFDKELIKKTISYGCTSAMQQVALQLGKIVVQTIVNGQGVNVMAAFTAVNRVDDFAFLPQQNISHAMTTFLAQNQGAGQKERMRKGFACGIFIELVYSIGLCFVMYIFAKDIMILFVDSGNRSVTSMGEAYIKRISFFYILPGLTNGIQGFFRGTGELKVTLLCTSVNMISRIIALVLMLQFYSLEFENFALANIIGWCVMLLVEVSLLIKSVKNFGIGVDRV
ncbi:MAG: MATE family efflux transporter [Coprococcus sp.]